MLVIAAFKESEGMHASHSFPVVKRLVLKFYSVDRDQTRLPQEAIQHLEYEASAAVLFHALN